MPAPPSWVRHCCRGGLQTLPILSREKGAGWVCLQTPCFHRGGHRVPKPATPPPFCMYFSHFNSIAMKFWGNVLHIIFNDFVVNLEALDCLIMRPIKLHYFGFKRCLIYLTFAAPWTWKCPNIISMAFFMLLNAWLGGQSEFWPLIWLHMPCVVFWNSPFYLPMLFGFGCKSVKWGFCNERNPRRSSMKMSVNFSGFVSRKSWSLIVTLSFWVLATKSV